MIERWHPEAGDLRSLEVQIRWVGARRGKWQQWGRLPETVGRDAFYQHMREKL